MNNKLANYIEKSLHLSIFAILFIVPLSFWLPAHEAFEMPKTTNLYILLSAAVTLFMALKVMRKDYSFKWTSFSLPAAGILIIFFLSIIKGSFINRHGAQLNIYFYQLIFSCILLYFIIVNTFSGKDIFKLMYFIFISHALVVAYGILQYLGIDFIKWVSFGKGRVYSTMGNPDYMAAQFTIVIPVIIALLLSPLNKLLRFSLFFLLAGMLFLTIVSHGRGAWLGFLVSIAFLILMFAVMYGKTFFIRYKLFFGSILAFIIFLGIFFAQPLKERIKQGMDITSDSVAIRLFYWESALQMGMRNPLLGVGVGGFSLNTAFYQRKVLDRWERVYPPIAEKVQPHVELYTHNDFLQTLSETGFLGLGAFLWLLFCSIFIPIKLLIREEDTLKKNILLGIAGGSIAFMVNGLLNFPWRVAPTLLTLWALFSILSTMEKNRTKTINLRESGLYVVFALSVFMVVFSVIQLRAFYANSLIKYGQGLFAQNRYEDSRIVFDKALESSASSKDKIELYLYAGNAYNALSNVNKAIELYNKGLEMFPHFIESHYNVGNVYNNNGMKDKAIEEYNKVLELNPKFTAAINNLANIYFADNQLDKAVEMYLRALKYKPESVEARYNLGATYFRQQKYQDAYRELNKTLEYDPNYELAKQWIKVIKDNRLLLNQKPVNQ